MKIIIASSGNLLSHKLDEHFGRSAWFVLFDKEHRKTEFFENPFKDLPGGIGEKIGDWLMEKEVKMVVAAEFGGKMRQKLEAAQIQMVVLNQPEITIQEVIKKINQ